MRLRKVAIADHLTTEQHKNAVSAELLQRISCFHEQLKEMRENNETIIENLSQQFIGSLSKKCQMRNYRIPWCEGTQVL